MHVITSIIPHVTIARHRWRPKCSSPSEVEELPTELQQACLTKRCWKSRVVHNSGIFCCGIRKCRKKHIQWSCRLLSTRRPYITSSGARSRLVLRISTQIIILLNLHLY
jgi:hypothetical protein